MKEGCKFNFSDLKKQVKLKGLVDLFCFQDFTIGRKVGWVKVSRAKYEKKIIPASLIC